MLEGCARSMSLSVRGGSAGIEGLIDKAVFFAGLFNDATGLGVGAVVGDGDGGDAALQSTPEAAHDSEAGQHADTEQRPGDDPPKGPAKVLRRRNVGVVAAPAKAHPGVRIRRLTMNGENNSNMFGRKKD